MPFNIDGTSGPITGDNIEVDGIPTGGYAVGVGFRIDWQDRPLGQGAEREEATGASIEDVLLACMQRLSFFQGETDNASGKFQCQENDLMIAGIRTALNWGLHRTRERTKQGVEGTNAGHT